MPRHSCALCPAQKVDDTPYRTCRECLDQVCENCTAPGTLIDDDGAPDADKDQGTVICRNCQPPEEQDEAEARAEREYRNYDRGEL